MPNPKCCVTHRIFSSVTQNKVPNCVRSKSQARLKSCLSLQPEHHPSLTAPHLHYTTNQERQDQCGNQHHSRELLMVGIVMLETY